MLPGSVGRENELTRLRAALDDARSGWGSTVLVAGEAGIGKTHLARRLASEAEETGWVVAWTRCWEDDGAPAYWPWNRLVRNLVERAPDLQGAPPFETPDPVEAGADAAQARFKLFDDVVGFLRTGPGPALLVLDDLHWADVSSLLLLRFAARELREAPIVILGTYRDDEVSPSSDRGQALRDIAGENGILSLSGLEAETSAELLRSVLGDGASEDLARTVHGRCRGNPLFVLEFGRLLRSASPASVTSTVPEGIRAVLERRLARVSQPCWALLSCAAVVGEEFRVDVVAEAAEEEDPLTLLDEAVEAQLVRVGEAPGRYAFTHALIRSVLYEHTPLSRRLGLHARIGEAIERAAGHDIEAHAAELAHHFVQAAGAGWADRALDHSELAGRRAMGLLAYEEAVAHFGHALEALDLTDGDDERRTQLLLARGEACIAAGDLPLARKVFEEAALLARRRSRPDQLAAAALGFGAGLGGFEVQMLDQRQVELLEEALEALATEDSALRAAVLGRLSVALSYRESAERRLALASQAVDVARRSGDEAAVASALAAHCDAISGPEHCEQRLAETAEIIRIARTLGDRSLELLGRRLRLVALLEQGDIIAADAEIAAFDVVAQAARQPLYTWYVPLWQATRALLDGKIDEAAALNARAERIGARTKSDNAPMLVAVQRSMIAVHRRDHAGARREEEVLQAFVGGYGHPYLQVFEAWISAAEGRVDEARAIVDRIRGAVRDFPVDSEWLPEMCQWAEVVAAAGAPEDARGLYERLLPFASRFGVEGIGAGLHGSVERHLGLLAAAFGEDELARRHLEAALDVHRRVGARLLEAITGRALATLLADLDPEQAEELLIDAEVIERPRGVGDRMATADDAPNIFHRHGELWTLTFEGRTVHMKDAKGLHDLATMLQRPGREVAALDLYTGSSPAARPSSDDLGTPGHAGELLDEAARDAYKQRLVDLEEDIEEADTLGDDAKAARLRNERDAIAAELASAYGLGGRPRRSGDPAERARSAVTQRIRDALRRIEREHPALARHLRASVRTGTFCSYCPEHPVTWDI